jgi:cobalt-zinc-cadmium efflux system outer membrane protein
MIAWQRVGGYVSGPWLIVAAAAIMAGCGATTRGPQHADRDAPAPRHAGAQPETHGATVDATTTGPLTLAQLLAYAEANAPALAVVAQRVKLGDAEIEGADALSPYNPEFAVSAGGRTAAGVSRFAFEVAIEQRLEVAGERGTRIEAAERSRDALGAEIDVARWELHAMVHALYYKLLVRHEQLVAAAKLEQFTRAVGEIIDKRVAAGEASPLETIVAKAELAKARQVALSGKQAHRDTTLRMAEVIGWPAAAPLAVAGALGDRHAVRDADALLREAMERHPSTRWLALEVSAAEARIEREDRQAWPDPSVGLSYGREADPGGATHVWLGTVRMPLPFFERNQAGRARVRAERDVARARQSAFEQALAIRIIAGVARVQAADERLRIYGDEILPAFEANLDKLQRAFVLGEVDVLTLSQIQQRILLTQKDALDALEDYYDALAALEALSGVDVLAKARP